MYSRSHLLEAVARSLADPIFVIDYDGHNIDVIGGDVEDVLAHMARLQPVR